LNVFFKFMVLISLFCNLFLEVTRKNDLLDVIYAVYILLWSYKMVNVLTVWNLTFIEKYLNIQFLPYAKHCNPITKPNRLILKVLTMVYHIQNYWVFGLFSIVRYSRNYKRQRFGNWICFRPQMCLSKRSNWVGVFPPTHTWGRKQIQFPKRLVL
jgi:hypothetical protein